ncbi:DUF2325 domain-containing protein [Bacillaceae bacterium S4-13-58]
MRQKILEHTKEILKKEVDEITIETIEERKNKIMKYLIFLENMVELPELDISSEGPSQIDPLPKENAQAYTFERKLVGGYVPERDVYLPEYVVRTAGISNGDKISLERKDTKKEEYFVHLLEKKNIPVKREEIQYGIVRRDGDLLLVDTTLQEGMKLIKIDDMPYTFLLREQDIQKMQLEDGDIVDIAYDPDNPNYFRVVWKHQIEDEIPPRPIKSGFYKQSNSSSSKGVEKWLDGYSILIVGCEPRKAIYKQIIEERGGEFLWFEGTEDEDRIRAAVVKSHFIIVLQPFIRHRASYLLVELCKEMHKPYKVIDSLGVASILRSIEELI